MAQLEPRPFPPGDYPVVVVGSGPGALQTSYFLSRLGIDHAVISDDDAPGGMFRHYPVFQRLITWTKPHSPAERGSRRYEWYDWNSLLGDEPAHRALLPEFMDGTSYFPARHEMEKGIVEFTTRAGIEVRYGCKWESTARRDDGFALTTSDGEYRCKIAVFAVGVAQPWKPQIPGLEAVPHYVEMKDPAHYAGKRVFLIGKRNSGFELADGLLAKARQIILGSPRPARISVLMHSTAGARARYLQPYEDHVLAGGNVVLDASIESVQRTDAGFRVSAKGTTRPGDLVLDVDEVLAATGFQMPMADLRALGVATFHQDRLPAQTPYWESASVPGIYFAGAITQGSIGMKKYGIPSNSAAVHGFRYNAKVLARHVAQTHFGVAPIRNPMQPKDVLDFLLSEATQAPELWNQQSYLAATMEFSDDGIFDTGIRPLAHFVDSPGADAIALAVETNAEGDVHPAVYVRRAGAIEEHLLPSDTLHDYEGRDHRERMASLLGPWIG